MRGSKEERPPRSGTWRLRVYAGRDPVTNQPRQVTRTVHGLKAKDADKALRALVDEVEKGRHQGTSANFGHLLDEWMRHIKHERSPYTLDIYRGKIEYRIRPALGAVALRDLKPAHIDRFLGSLRAEGLRPSTVHQHYAIIRRALVVAMRWEWIERNPAERVEPPSVGRAEVVAPTVDEVHALLLAADAEDPVLGALLAVAALTSARRGELCGLRWSDVDVDGRTLHVRRSVYDGAGGPRVKDTKTHQARRIVLDDRAAAVLVAHRAETEQRARGAGSPLVADPYVFSRSFNGATIYRPGWASKAFERLRDDLGLPHLHLHSLRHFAPTRILAKGATIYAVAERLGHAAIATTQLYTHHDPAAAQRAAELVGELLPGEPKP